MQYTFQYHVYYSIQPMFAQHTIDVRLARTKTGQKQGRQSEESWRLRVAGQADRPCHRAAEKILPVLTGSEHSQTTGGATLIVTNQIKCRITIQNCL